MTRIVKNEVDISAVSSTRLWNIQSLGNHEFDEGIEGLLPFLEAANFPVLVSNMQTDREPQMTGKTSKSLVTQVGGHQIGIIGYIFPDTTVTHFQTCIQRIYRPYFRFPVTSSFVLQKASVTGNLSFTDEMKSLNNEADLLINRGVNIIIAVGHSGYSRDLEIAQHCPQIDVVVGAHSHSLLWNGTSTIH